MDARKSRYSSSTQQESCLMMPPGRLTGPDELQEPGWACACCARARWALAGPSAAIIRARAGADLAIARAICGESGRRTHPLDKLEALTTRS